MSDLPKRVTIDEEGPREGFQSEKKMIPVAGKVCLTEVAKIAEDVVGRPLPGHVMCGGTLTAAKQKANA